MSKAPVLEAQSLSLGYDDSLVVRELSLQVEPGRVTTIIGPNGCGKSTLLRALARLMRPKGGSVLLDGQIIHRLPTKDVAKRLGLLRQQSLPPGGITVEDIVRRGRYPHQSFLQMPSLRDREAVEHALELTDMVSLRDRPMEELSGGQRQRAWIAMALAQETELLLLDEPTTFLDVAHQLEITELVRRLNEEQGRTVVMVLHDINEAARASDQIVAMREGEILRSGPPEKILQPALLRELYGLECDIVGHPADGKPFCQPVDRGQPAATGRSLGEAIEARGLVAGYSERMVVIDSTNIGAPAGAITAIVGPNACGKSTFLRTAGRLLKPLGGDVHLGGTTVYRGSHRSLAKRLSMLAQGPAPPQGFLVDDLVASGRAPHQRPWRQWSDNDESAIQDALSKCDLGHLRFRELETLSGGQRQRAWIAMTLAQDAGTLLLDEPTTFLDIAHQVEVLDLVRDLNRREGRTVVMVLHDLNMAARYADHLVAMKDGAVVASGDPANVVTEDLVARVFGIRSRVVRDEATGKPLVFPIAVNACDEAVARRLPVGSLLGGEAIAQASS